MYLQKNIFHNLNIVSQFDQKARTWVEIDKKAILHNLNQFKAIIGSTTELAVVAKSNAYGHGLASISQICQESEDTKWICVFALSEALIARDNGYEKNILILGQIDVDVELAILYSIDIVVYDIDLLSTLNEAGKKLKKQVNIHIKVDTGLSRLGFLPDDAFHAIKIANQLSFINLRGVFSHFSESDANDQAFTHKQLSRFNLLLSKLLENGINIPFIHSSNTAGIIRFESCHFNFVRLGGGTYGMYKSASIDELGKKKYQLNLKLAISWKTRIIQIKEIPAGTYVSYARTFITYRPTRIAIIPIGYWDGYNRLLSNKGIVYIKGQPGFVIGRVCMNMIIVDITDSKDIVVGDEVILMSNLPGITPDEIAVLSGTINYEVTTKINPMIPRIIV